MKHDKCYLPNGQIVSVSQIFGGFKFKLGNHCDFPPEWTICLWTDGPEHGDASRSEDVDPAETDSVQFTKPSRNNDSLYLSSLSMSSIKDPKPGSAPTRQVAMILWVTFYWYFQEPDPNSEIPEPARVWNDWRLKVEPKGLLRGPNTLMKLERLAIIASNNTSVSAQSISDVHEMFISQRAFWQLDPRLYLVSLSPFSSSRRSISPNSVSTLDSFGTGFPFGAGPNTTGSFLPSYYPPQPLQYSVSENNSHPIRPKSYRQGEVFYVRYIPRGDKYLTFRVPVLPSENRLKPRSSDIEKANSQTSPDLCLDSELECDVRLLHNWMETRPTNTALTRKGPISAQLEFLKEQMSHQNLFPAVACWGSIPVGYFEIFWVFEDPLGRLLGDAEEWDRGIRCFIGNTDFLKPGYIAICLSSLVHYCWLYDQRTDSVVFDVRAENMRYGHIYPRAFLPLLHGTAQTCCSDHVNRRL